jgi:hypothetical protein
VPVKRISLLLLIVACSAIAACSDSNPTSGPSAAESSLPDPTSSDARCEGIPTNGARFEALLGEPREAFQDLADELGYRMTVTREDDVAFVINTGASVNRAYVEIDDGIITAVSAVQSAEVKGRIDEPCVGG